MAKCKQQPIVTTYAPWLTGIHVCDFREKDEMLKTHIQYMINRCESMFEWQNLPETIPAYILEQMLQNNGHCVIARAGDGKLYAFTGGYGGAPDVYYRGTVYNVVNPAVNVENDLIIGKNCVLLKNDSLNVGLMPLHRRYASMLVENELSLYCAQIITRLQLYGTAGNDSAKKALDVLIENTEKGKIGTAMSSEFMNGVKIQPGAQYAAQTMQAIIESEQFINAQWFNALCIDANYNMKRESLTTTESQMNSDALHPLIDDMYKHRINGVKESSAMFDEMKPVSVDYGSSWKIKNNEYTSAETNDESVTDNE